ncbi:MAG: hypothetical protein AAGG51_14940 [Cyanobacteria bacterium P01_G01_bin.54]
MVEQPNLFWFGFVLWAGGSAFLLSLLSGKIAVKPDLSQRYAFDPVLGDRLRRLSIEGWAAFQRNAGLTSRQLKQVRQGYLDSLSFQELQHLAQTLDWTLEELLQAYGVPFPSLESVFQDVAKLHEQGETVSKENQQLQTQLLSTQAQLEAAIAQTQEHQERISLLEAEMQRRENLWQTNLEDANNQVLQLQQQCRRLRDEAQQQATLSTQTVIESSFVVLQTLLMNYPTARVMVAAKPNLPARNFIPLFTPLDNLLQNWGYEPIGTAWDKVIFDPRFHQSDEPNIHEGELVYVRFVGYRDGDRVLCPAKVSRTLPLP